MTDPPAAARLPSLAGRDLSARLISYSQNAEDVRLWRVLGDQPDGFYVDIGAYLPEAGSVTKLFYDAGYEFAAFDGLNRFYVATEHAELREALAYPIGVLDNYVTATQYGLEVDRLVLTGECQTLQARLDEGTAERQRLAAQLQSVLDSHTWKAGRVVAAAAAPVLALLRRLRRTS